MEERIKGLNLLEDLCQNNNNFNELINEGLKNKLIRYFNQNEWQRIEEQNFIPPMKEIKDFRDYFIQGYNIGDCVGASMQLSFSYDNVDIVSGILPILKGTPNALKEGGHCWLETERAIIDTSFMLVIDKSLKEKFGYHEEQRITQYQLHNMTRYQARKEFVNDKELRRKK